MVESEAKSADQGPRLELAGGGGVLIRALNATREVRRVKPNRLKQLAAGAVALEAGRPA